MRIGEAESVVLEGVLVPVSWGPSGEALEIGLMTYDEGEYTIDPIVARRNGLKQRLRRCVRLWAVVRGSRVITVAQVEVIDEPSP